MIRIVTSVTLALAAVYYVLSLMETDAQERKYDVWQEALMYEVTTERSLVFNVPADSERIVFDLIGVIPPPESYDAQQLHPFEFELQVTNDVGRGKRTLVWAAPRVSLSDFPPLPDSRRGAKLMDKSLWATDSVERIVDLGDLFRGEAGQLTVRLRPSNIDALLVRAFAEQRNVLAFDEMRAHRLPREERRELGMLGSGLGFGDVPSAALRRAVGHYRVRLDTAGKRGRDYVLRRVLSSNYRASEAEEIAKPSFAVSPELWAAFNFERDTWLSVEGPPGAIVVWELGSFSPSRILELDQTGKGTLDLAIVNPTTLVLATLEPMQLSVRIAEASLTSLLSDGRQVNSHDQARWLQPDYRRMPWSVLRPEEPVCFELGSLEGQKQVLLSLRGIGAGGADVKDVTVETLPAGKPRIWRETGELSTFEIWTDGPRATDTLYKRLSVRKDVEKVCMSGPERYAVRAFAEDESVPAELYEDPYDDILEHGYGWINAPREIRRWVPLAPVDSQGTLLGEARMRMLLAQVRLFRRGLNDITLASNVAAPRARPVLTTEEGAMRSHVRQAARFGSRLLVPAGVLHAQRVFVRTPRKPGLGKSFVWTDVSAGRTLAIAESGVTTVALRTPAAQLPSKVELRVDGVLAASVAVRLPVQSVSLALLRGERRVQLVAAPGVRAFAAAQAADFQPLFLERQAYQLDPGQSLRFYVPVKRGELLGFSFDAFSEQPGAPYRLQARVSGRLPETWVGVTSPHPEVHFWDRDFERAGGSFHGLMDLPVASQAGMLEVELVSKAEQRTFVRAVLIGQSAEPRPSTFSISRRREP